MRDDRAVDGLAVVSELDRVAAGVARLLLKGDSSLVLAESCTAGLAAASLAGTPGISARLAGSFVVYQIDSKREWLGIPASFFARSPDGVSEEIAVVMASRALVLTPHARFAAAITGRLGPSDSPREDGTAWIAVAERHKRVKTQRVTFLPSQKKATPALRKNRQVAASILILRMVRSMLTHRA